MMDLAIQWLSTTDGHVMPGAAATSQAHARFTENGRRKRHSICENDNSSFWDFASIYLGRKRIIKAYALGHTQVILPCWLAPQQLLDSHKRRMGGTICRNIPTVHLMLQSHILWKHVCVMNRWIHDMMPYVKTIHVHNNAIYISSQD